MAGTLAALSEAAGELARMEDRRAAAQAARDALIVRAQQAKVSRGGQWRAPQAAR